LCIAGASAVFTSCNKEEEDKAIVLESFGPMPIARGAELKFIGKNLDKVSSIVMPDNIEISTFGTQTKTLLTVTVPQEATPGLIVLKTPEGDITTKTEIGFSEPISIESFAPGTIKPGSELTITGDYLNLVNQVIFTDRIAVEKAAFISQSRTELKLLVPATAQTGKIAVSDGAEDPIIVYSSSGLTVKLPVFTSVLPNPVKAGTELTITGTDLDLVKTIILGGSKNVATFVSQSATEIVLTVPDDTKDGKITLVPASSLNVVSAADLIMVVPTVSVTPTTLKNGADITVTGTNLDLVDKVVFGGGKQGTIKAGGSETEILVTVPNDAITGDVTFVTKATKEVTGPSLTIIDPVLTSFTPASAKAGVDLTITGTDLDLVVDVTFFGGIKGTIGTRTVTELTVTVPVGAKTGIITLVTKNAAQIGSADDFTVLANLPVFTSYTQTRGEPGKKLTINGTNMLLIKEIIFPNNIYATAYGSKTDAQVEVYVPTTVSPGFGTIKLITYEGEEGLFPDIYFGGTDPVLNQTLCFFDFNGTGKDSWWGNAMGSGIATDAPNSSDGTPFWRINGMSGTGWWDGLFFRNGSNNFVTTGVNATTWAVRFDVNILEPITEGILKIRFGSYMYDFKPWDGVAGGYKTVGWITVTCPLSGFKNGSVVLTDPSAGGSEFGMIWSSGTSVKVNMMIDNIRFEPIP
jgi:hypothetical protein